MQRRLRFAAVAASWSQRNRSEKVGARPTVGSKSCNDLAGAVLLRRRRRLHIREIVVNITKRRYRTRRVNLWLQCFEASVAILIAVAALTGLLTLIKG